MPGVPDLQAERTEAADRNRAILTHHVGERLKKMRRDYRRMKLCFPTTLDHLFQTLPVVFNTFVAARVEGDDQHDLILSGFNPSDDDAVSGNQPNRARSQLSATEAVSA